MAARPARWLAEEAIGARLRVADLARRLRSWPARMALARLALTGEGMPTVLFAPQDLRTTDPVRADELVRGLFIFAGRCVEAADPFVVAPPSPEWRDGLDGFAWLRHLRAAGTAEAAATARRLVDAWLASQKRRRPASWRPEALGERLRAWLAASGLLLGEADRAFYRRFARALWRQTRMLEAQLPAVAPDIRRLDALIALVTVGLCCEGEGRLLRRSARLLGRELERQILADGGHVSRNPAFLPALVLDLLPLRQLFFARNEVPPAALLTAVDRIMPMIRFLQLGDGTLARFNGMGPTAIDQVATALVYDGSRGRLGLSARQSGYERMEAGATTLLADCGTPPPPDLALDAHAGCLAFEMTVGRQLVVMNCGAPPAGRIAWREPVRRTAGHSTLVIGERSSARFRALPRIGTVLIAGPRTVAVERSERILSARHDGWRETCGVVHARRLALSEDGTLLEGEDRLEGPPVPHVLRFHLHPAIQPIATEQGLTVLLRWSGGEVWAFTADRPVAIEESVAVALADGPRRSVQLVVPNPTPRPGEAIVWSFRRLNRPRQTAVSDADAPTLPL